MLKLHKNYLLQALLFIAAVVGMNSCSCNSKETVEDKIDYLVSDEVDVVVTGDISRAMSALEVTADEGNIVLPDYLTDFIASVGGRSELREFEKGMENVKGIDYTNSIFAARASGKDADMLFAFNITDEEEFYNTMVEFDDDFYMSESGDFKVICIDEGDKEFAALVIDDNLAIFVAENGRPLESDDAVKMVEKWISKADEKPLAEWKKNYLIQPAIASAWCNFGGLMEDMEPRISHEIQDALDQQGTDFKLADFSFGVRFDLAGPSAKFNVTGFDGSGTVFQNPYAGTFDAGLLDYAIPTDYVAASFAINDKGIDDFVKMYKAAMDENINDMRSHKYDYYDQEWAEQYARDLTELRNTVVSLAESFDGNVMAAIGTAPGVNLSTMNITDIHSYHFVAAVKCKPGKTHDVFNMICQAVDAECGDYSADAALADTAAVISKEAPTPAVKSYGDSYHNRFKMHTGYDPYNYDPIYTSVDLYAKIEGNTIIFSNAPISRKGGSKFDRNVFSSNAVAVQVKVDKDSPLVREFNLPCGLEATVAGSGSFDFDVTFSGTGQNFVPALFKIISGLNY